MHAAAAAAAAAAAIGNAVARLLALPDVL